MIRSLLLSVFLLSSALTWAQGTVKTTTKEPELTRLLFIFDGSNSMNAQWQSSSKIRIAKQLMKQTLDSLKGIPNIEFALRMYGHQTKIYPGQQDCNDTKLEVPFAPGDGNIDRIKSKIRGLQPQGTTPIARSLEYSADDFPECDNCRNVIILITDGIEACDEDPCAVARALRSKGIILKPFVIGIGIDPSQLTTLKCIGKYYDANSEATFKTALGVVVSEALNNTSVQVNLNDDKGAPKETNAPMVFYDQKTGAPIYNFMHTLNERELPDTLSIDPLKTYRLEVYTIPRLVKENIKLAPGTHNIIELDAAQGFLDMQINGTNYNYPEIKCLIKDPETKEIIHVQGMGTTEKLLVGTYDLELLTLPRMKFEKVKIKSKRHNTIEIPQPGNLNVQIPGQGYGVLYQLKDGKQEWVCPLDCSEPQKQMVLQPGKYLIVYRSTRARAAAYTVTKSFRITSGLATDINLLHP